MISFVRLTSIDIDVDLYSKPGETPRTYSISGSVTYEAHCNNANDKLTPITIALNRNLPKIGDYYRENGVIYYYTFYTKIKTKYDGIRKGRYIWTLEYTVDGTEKEEEKDDTTLCSISTSSEDDPTAYAADMDGRWNVNSAGDFFSDPLTYNHKIRVFRFHREEYHNPMQAVIDYENTINSDLTWGLFQPYTLLCRSITHSVDIKNHSHFWSVDYEIAYRSSGWLIPRVNAGYFAFRSGNKYRILNEDGSPTEEVSLLNDQGGLLTPGATPSIKYFRCNPTKNFGFLNLPNPFGGG